MTWMDEIEIDVGSESPPLPNWAGGVPFCSEEKCPHYDGKRCRILGNRPGHICEPCVAAMGRGMEALDNA